jgi:hypothetical protein
MAVALKYSRKPGNLIEVARVTVCGAILSCDLSPGCVHH